jgi:TetR/AcrR family transcriptional regulator
MRSNPVRNDDAEDAAETAPGATALVSRRVRVGEKKRQRILDAALEIFSRNGLHGARLDQVAERADVSKTNLLYYYETKEVLYLAVLSRMLDRWLEPLEALTPDSDPAQAISAYITRKLALSRDEPAASRLFCMEMLQGAPLLGQLLSGPLKRLVDRKALVIRRWIREGRLADVDPRHLLFAIWSMTQHYADFEVQVEALTGQTLGNAAFEARTIRNVLAIILHGALPRTHSAPVFDPAG